MSDYLGFIKSFQKKVEKYTQEIFKVYGNELQLKLEDFNLLENKNNCLESSTAFGYIIEEFLVSKLEIYTKLHNNTNDYKIVRSAGSTTNASYDCFCNSDIFAMINIKAVKETNNAISAINILYNDYVKTNPNTEKCFLVLKVFYKIDTSNIDGKRKIIIGDIKSFFLEEIDFSKTHTQDHRNWSENFNANSGRLQVSDKFRKEHRVLEKDISYQNTCNMLESIINRNKT